MKPGQQGEDHPVVVNTASGAGVRLVQPGWRVQDANGEDIGRVISITNETLVVQRSGLTTPDRVSIPFADVAEEDEEAMLVILSVTADDADAHPAD